MPLHELNFPKGSERVLLWHITESEPELSAMAAGEGCPDELTHSGKRKEWFAGRLLARALAQCSGLPYKGVGVGDGGKPYLKGAEHWFSITHSFPYAAAQVSHCCPVGIDLEHFRSSLLTVSSRVLNKEEQVCAGNNLVKLCVYWCAKEALYKAHGGVGTSLVQQLQIAPFCLSDEGELVGYLKRGGARKKARFYYKVYPRFVLVYSKEVRLSQFG